jgi:predicted double-glycine peptidase
VPQRWDMSCGAASLATLLRYQHGDAVTEKQVAEQMLERTTPLQVKVKGGFSLLDLKRYAESRGFAGTGYLQLHLNDLEKLAPAIVPINMGDFNHFVVFRGRVGDRVLLADPAFGNLAVDVETFQRSWLKNIGFAVTRRDAKPPPNRLEARLSDLPRVPDAAVRHAVQR